MVDLKCEKVKNETNIFFVTIKVFTLKKKINVEIFCWYAVEREPVPMRVLNPKASGALGGDPGGGAAGRSPPQKKIDKKNVFFFFLKVKKKS